MAFFDVDETRPAKTFLVEDLMKRIGSLYGAAVQGFAGHGLAYVLRDFFIGTGLARAMVINLDDLTCDDEERASAARARLDAIVEDALAAVRSFFGPPRAGE